MRHMQVSAKDLMTSGWVLEENHLNYIVNYQQDNFSTASLQLNLNI